MCPTALAQRGRQLLPRLRVLGRQGRRRELLTLADDAAFAALAPGDGAAALEAFTAHRVIPDGLVAAVQAHYAQEPLVDGTAAAALGRALAAAPAGLAPLHPFLGSTTAGPAVTFTSDDDRIDYVWGCLAAGLRPRPFVVRYAPPHAPALRAPRQLWRLRPECLGRLLWCMAREGGGATPPSLADEICDELVAQGLEGLAPLAIAIAAYGAARVGTPAARQVLVLADKKGRLWPREENTRLLHFEYATLYTACATGGVYPKESLDAAHGWALRNGLALWKPQHLLAAVQAAAAKPDRDAPAHAILALVAEQLRMRRDAFPLFVAQHMLVCWRRADPRGAPDVLTQLIADREAGLPPRGNRVGRKATKYGRPNPLPDPLAAFERVTSYDRGEAVVY